ncbi:MAG: hypothetical protein JRH20_13750 [Deltaproteobacteria bacterium]|nr:hypothetical protein [Deltaproteobacteria bacterium]
MIIFTYAVIIPLLLATGSYYLFGLFLSEVNALGAACLVGSFISTAMEWGGIRGTLFWIPAGAWLGLVALNRAFGLFDLALVDDFTGQAGVAFSIMAVITAIFGVLSIAGLFAGKRATEDS